MSRAMKRGIALCGLIAVCGSASAFAQPSPPPPSPAQPPAAGTKPAGESSVFLHRTGDAPDETLEIVLPIGGRAFTDAVGPVVVTAERIIVFSGVYGIDASRTSRNVSAVRPDATPAAAPASCAVLVHGPSGHERAVETLSRSCLALTDKDVASAVRDARSTMRR